MGSNCGWLTAATANVYRQRLSGKKFLDHIFVTKNRGDIDAVYLPELQLVIKYEAERLTKICDARVPGNMFPQEVL